MNEKRPYSEPKLEVTELTEDILTTSTENFLTDEQDFNQQQP